MLFFNKEVICFKEFMEKLLLLGVLLVSNGFASSTAVQLTEMINL